MALHESAGSMLYVHFTNEILINVRFYNNLIECKNIYYQQQTYDV